MKKLILTLIIVVLFMIAFFPTIGRLTTANTLTTLEYELSNTTTDTFDVIDNNIDININGSEIDEDNISILPVTNPYSNTLTLMINGMINGVDDAYNLLQYPSTVPSGSVYGGGFSPDSTKMFVTYSVSPFIRIYDITTDPMTIYTTLDDFVPQPYRTAVYSPDGNYLAIGIGGSSGGSPYMTLYRTDITPYSRLSDPENPAGIVLTMQYNPSGTQLAIGHLNAPYLTIYDTTSIPYTKITNPSTLPTGTVNKLSYNHDGSLLIVGTQVSPYVLVYDTSTTPYTIMNNMIEPVLTTVPNGIVFTKDDSKLILGSNRLDIYDTTTSPFTRLNTSTMDTGTLDINHDDSILVAKFQSSTPRIYNFNSMYDLLTLFDTSYNTNPSVIMYSPNGSRLLIVHSSYTPTFSLYDTNIKYFNILDQDSNILQSLDFDTNYVDELIELEVSNLDAISFESLGVDPLLLSTLSIDVTLIDSTIENDSMFTPLIKLMPLVAFVIIVTIAVAYVSRHKNA